MKNRSIVLIIAIALSIFTVAACSSLSKDQGANGGDSLVGVYYFTGWWEGRGNGWFNGRLREWLPDYPDREPLLGKFTKQETMNREIIAASEHGVDFFQFLWHSIYGPRVPDAYREHINDGPDFFAASPESHRMRFIIHYGNDGGMFAVNDEDTWKQVCSELIAFMKHPSYMHVNGKAMILIGNIRSLVNEAGGMRTAVEWVQYLREAAAEEGVGELLLGAGIQAHDNLSGIQVLMNEFDYVQAYMDITDMQLREKEYSYNHLAKRALYFAENRAAGRPLPYVPYIPSGWNPRPWTPTGNIYFRLPTRRQWNTALSDMKKIVERNSYLGIPDGTEGGQKMVVIYCWNEFGEGGIVAPTRGDQFMKLEEIQRVFRR